MGKDQKEKDKDDKKDQKKKKNNRKRKQLRTKNNNTKITRTTSVRPLPTKSKKSQWKKPWTLSAKANQKLGPGSKTKDTGSQVGNKGRVCAYVCNYNVSKQTVVYCDNGEWMDSRLAYEKCL